MSEERRAIIMARIKKIWAWHDRFEGDFPYEIWDSDRVAVMEDSR